MSALAKIKAIKFGEEIYRIGVSNETIFRVYDARDWSSSPRVNGIEQINELSVRITLSNDAALLIPIRDAIIFYQPI